MKLVLLSQQTAFSLSPTESTLYLVLLDQQAREGQVKVDLHFTTSDVACQLLFIGRLAVGSDWQLETNMYHQVPKTSCMTDVYLSQADRSKVDYFGQIYIDRQATHTKSFLQEQSLVIGRSTSNRSRPILEIFNNKVKASHSASSSRLNESDVFYLMSRGLLRAEAEKLLEQAFFDRILAEKVKDKTARQLISDYLC